MTVPGRPLLQGRKVLGVVVEVGCVFKDGLQVLEEDSWGVISCRLETVEEIKWVI
jgi:hypothetical protein